VRPAAASRRILAGGVASCLLTGAYSDNEGIVALVVEDAATGALNLTSLSSAPRPHVALASGEAARARMWSTAFGFFDARSLAGWVAFGAGDNLTFTAVAGCSVLRFSNGESWRAAQPVANITTVHIV
jgi:hypothetical protein